MKTIIYSEKYPGDHTYSTSYTNGSYNQLGCVLPKKSSITKKFENVIASSSIKPSKEIHLHVLSNEQQNLMNISNTSSHIMKPKKPTQKPVPNHPQLTLAEQYIKEYTKIITNLQTYEQYYKIKLQRQAKITDDYFKDVIKAIQQQQILSSNTIQKHINEMTSRIKLQIGVLANKIYILQKNPVHPHLKELEELKSQHFLQIPLFQFRPAQIDWIKEEVGKLNFDIKTVEEIENSMVISKVLNETINLQDSRKNDKNQKAPFEQISAQQLEKMTPIHQIYQSSQTAKLKTNLEDKDLYCDEDIENILKENKIVRKRRYQCREDPIPEESESHEDSGILSQIDTLNSSFTN